MENKNTYLVANQQIVFGAGGYCEAGTIFIIAENDNGQGGWHARQIHGGPISDQGSLEMDYSEPDFIHAKDADYDSSSYVFIPGHAAWEYTSEEEALKASAEYFNDNEFPYA